LRRLLSARERERERDLLEIGKYAVCEGGRGRGRDKKHGNAFDWTEGACVQKLYIILSKQ